MSKKRLLGQFFTKGESWLKPQVVDFIKKSGSQIAYDPFAGGGDMLKAAKKHCGLSEAVGLDIDTKLNWSNNDSLVHIPHVDGAIIITNPPYISNYSASRKGLSADLEKYFKTSRYTDIYMIALDNMITAQKNVVAVVPETFINSNYARKDLLECLTILEENPFDDTENPVLVACFDGVSKDLAKIKIYKNDQYINSLGGIESLRPRPIGNVEMVFNDKAGWLAVRCVDTTNPENMIVFGSKDNIHYDWDNRIKVSSRLLTLIDVNVKEADRLTFMSECNKLLQEIRDESSDIILSPFKGNMKNGRRRRRLDFMTCRAIIEQAYRNFYKGNKEHKPYAAEQQVLF